MSGTIDLGLQIEIKLLDNTDSDRYIIQLGHAKEAKLDCQGGLCDKIERYFVNDLAKDILTFANG